MAQRKYGVKAKKFEDKARRQEQLAKRDLGRAKKTRAKARREKQRARQARPRYTNQEVHAPRGWFSKVFGIAAYLVIGVFPYLASGLLVPVGAVFVLMVVWAIGLVVVIDTARNTPQWTWLAPIMAMIVWVAFVQAGEALFGWSA